MSEAEPPRIRVTFLGQQGLAQEAKEVGAASGSSLLRVSLREKGGIPFKCGGGLCGTCKCRIEAGLENAAPITAKERKHLTEAEFAAGWRMACQTFLNGDVSVSWPPAPPRGASSQAKPA